MTKDLTISNIERQNILNNRLAIEAVAEQLSVTVMLFEGEYRFTKAMVAEYYEVDERTVERYIENFHQNCHTTDMFYVRVND